MAIWYAAANPRGTAAQKTLNGGEVSALQLVADTSGITALIRDEHGTAITIQRGRISVNVNSGADTAK
jgi:hypothetical protein